ncbi:toll-like receptor 2 type-2 [Plakobranchus ocellatus]|uniref:Toll-like receptor 2 type-2 n=1 Tax=Plakobranchus ocellatus TaxID=259542 RepID=A0AAV4BZB0_9GAST|nr:toll-like receptor 2 type-2 [Plakobranchus ocellatus]
MTTTKKNKKKEGDLEEEMEKDMMRQEEEEEEEQIKMEPSKLTLAVRLILILCCTWIHVAHCTTRLSGESNEDGELNALCLNAWPFEDQKYWNFQYGTVADTNFDEDLISCVKTLDGSTVKTSTMETLRNGPQECQVIKKDIGTYVNCTSRNLKRVPSTNFPPHITVFNLSDNGITQLPGRAFSKYSVLRDLSIRNNHIFKIDPLAFSGLSNLESLDLYGNQLVMNPVTMKNAFSDNVFAPLKNLKELRLNRNNPQPDDRALRYPDKALAQLSNLETLFLDGFTEPVFGSGFANLTRLKYLNLNGYREGYCKLSGLKNETFRHMTSLEHLLIRECQLQGHKIEAATFLPLKKLHFLDLSKNQDINVQFFDRLFYGLQNTSTLKHLHMEFVVNLYTLGVCLSSKYIKYFPQSVEYLGVQSNKLECIDRNVIHIIGKSLKVIDISQNNFIFGTYFLDFPKLSQLTTLIIDGYGYLPVAHRLPKIYPFNPHTPQLDTENCSLYESDEIKEYTQDFILHLPPKLKNLTLGFANLKNIISKLTVDENNVLEDLTLIGNYFPILEGPICGLKSIKSCRLMKNSISTISEQFF